MTTLVHEESRPMTKTPHADSADHGYISDKDRYLARLKRIEGQARGIHRMIDEEKYCIDILTQISSITSALNTVALSLLDLANTLTHHLGVFARGEMALQLRPEQHPVLVLLTREAGEGIHGVPG